MKKIVKLTESDLTRIVKRVINEQSEIKIFDPKQVINIPKETIKVKTWFNKEGRNGSQPRDFNLDTYDHKLVNDYVSFKFKSPGDDPKDNLGKREGNGTIRCGELDGKMFIDRNGWSGVVYVTEAARKKLTKWCDAYASNDTKNDNDYV